MKRLVLLALLALAAQVGLAACAGPYSGKPETLKKPRTKKRPKDLKAPTEVAENGAPVVQSAEPCRTNFFGDPFKGRRKSREARTMAAEAETILVGAERVPDQRLRRIVEAIDVLTNALAKDPYGPEPTYKLSVAYAMAGRKSCSLAVLERLKALQLIAEVEAEAARTIQRAARDPAFEPFRNDAKRALGQ